MNPKTDFYFSKIKSDGANSKWHQELNELRSIVLDCGLTEELKWGCPCYSSENKNILLIHVFKEYCAFLFFKGSLLKDDHKILIQQSANVQSARQIRFTDAGQIVDLKPILKVYIYEAIEVEKAGLKVSLKKTAEFDVPNEFQNRLDENPALKLAFNSLTPGRQRAYLLHFSAPKQSKTRESRIEKTIGQILNGKGLND